MDSLLDVTLDGEYVVSSARKIVLLNSSISISFSMSVIDMGIIDRPVIKLSDYFQPLNSTTQKHRETIAEISSDQFSVDTTQPGYHEYKVEAMLCGKKCNPVTLDVIVLGELYSFRPWCLVS